MKITPELTPKKDDFGTAEVATTTLEYKFWKVIRTEFSTERFTKRTGIYELKRREPVARIPERRLPHRLKELFEKIREEVGRAQIF